MSLFGDFGALMTAPPAGALAGPTSSVLAYDSGTSSTSPIPFDSEAYDTDNWHSTSSNTERFVVPAGVSYARAITMVRLASGAAITQCLKSGASFPGCFANARSDTSGADQVSAATAIVSVSAGNYFTFENGTGLTTSTGSWGAVEAIPSTRKMALVQKSADQAISAATFTTITFNTELRDTDAFHDNSTNNSRLTVPSGVSLVRLSANIRGEHLVIGDQIVVLFQKNGGSVVGLAQKDQTHYEIGATSAILAVSAGDYFECQVHNTSASNVKTDDATWFQIEEIDSATKYALVNKSGTQAISATTFTAVAFGAEQADTSAFHDNSTNNSRLTIPSGQGITQARLQFNLHSASANGEFIAEVRKNGSSSIIPGLPRQETDTLGTDNNNGFGAWIDVVAGDYFELFVWSANAQTLPVDDTTWFCIETR